jgi:hypothetical protein
VDAQGSKLTANDETGDGAFGSSVTLSANGSTALIGGDADNGDNDSGGAAWVFTPSGSSWTQQSGKLTANNETGDGDFGDAVALSPDGGTVLIGGPANSGSFNSGVGAAWVFTRSDSIWNQQGPKLTPSDESGAGGFGDCVALSSDGNTALIGADGDNGNFGAAWMFTRSSSTWAQQGMKLTPDDETASSTGEFGSSVASSSDGITGPSGSTGTTGVSALIGGADDTP